jgi:GTPase
MRTDLAGHERYLKTTLYGLTSGAPSCVILIVGANAGLIGMSKEHLAIALALGVPVVVVITKIDMTPPNIQAETIKQVVKILKSPGCRYVGTTKASMHVLRWTKGKHLCLSVRKKLRSRSLRLLRRTGMMAPSLS